MGEWESGAPAGAKQLFRHRGLVPSSHDRREVLLRVRLAGIVIDLGFAVLQEDGGAEGTIHRLERLLYRRLAVPARHATDSQFE